MIALLVLTDGRRECIEPTLASADAMVTGPVTRWIIHDDSADPRYRGWLTDRYGERFEIIGGDQRRGFGGAIRAAWDYLRPGVQARRTRFVFHLEDDFTFNRPVDLADMISILARHRKIAQVALRRQPWNDAERAAGGLVELHPSEYVNVLDAGCWFHQHRLFFTTNPSLYRGDLVERGWPAGERSEGVMTEQLRAAGYSFAYLGQKHEAPWVEHIGAQRAGTGY